MKIGAWLHDHFYRKFCGKPMYGLEENGWFFLDMNEVRRVTPEIFRYLRSLEVECVELGHSLGRAERMKKVLKERHGIELILHTEGDPPPAELASPDEHVKRASLENVKRNIEFAKELNVNTLVLHPPSCSSPSLEVFKELTGYAEKRKVVIAIENCKYGRDGIEEVLKYGESIASEYFGYTFDAGHCNIGFSPAEGAKMLGSKIIHVHWHDNDGTRDQHLGPGMGTIDFNSLVKTLREIEKVKRDDMSVTLECDKTIVDYEKELAKLRNLKNR